ncbi:hypothetical protein MLD38_004176 [Melastoma candidum]|uniref:Uncharacterized protein n=1 Tax=Melastoma candidum TaxID=119954 RepID=A0ACB9S832_9MYRT|nr:hypothetical protein MLD38_004176 [Melastoma candidum]
MVVAATKLRLLLLSCIASLSGRVSSSTPAVAAGRIIHQLILSLGLRRDAALSKALVEFYLASGRHGCAELLVIADSAPSNALLSGYVKRGMFTEALNLFRRMISRSPPGYADCYAYPSVLKACGGLGWILHGQMVHCNVLKSGLLSDVVVTSSAVGMYAKCGLFDSAVKLFNEMYVRDVASWNTVMSCFYQDGNPEKALEFFKSMKCEGVEPNAMTFTTAVASCARLLDLEMGKEIHHELIRSGFSSDDIVCSALVDMYGRCGSLDKAKDIFEQMRLKNVIAWNAMIAGYSLNGDSKSCIGMLVRMLREGIKPSVTTLSSLMAACSRSAQLLHGKFIHGYIYRNSMEADSILTSSLIDLYCKCDRVASAETIFRSSPVDITTYNQMISGYVAVGYYFEALDVFDEMKEVDVRPNAITLTSALSACSHLASLERGREIHHFVLKNRVLESNEVLMSALLDMYAKCGAIEAAHNVFEQMVKRDRISWTGIINAYGSSGHAPEALKYFAQMQESGIKPDDITFLAMLSACSHGGLVDEGYSIFNQMVTLHGLNPRSQHYSCLVDMLGRAGRLHEAYQIISSRTDLKRDAELLSTLFSACCMLKEVDLGEEIVRVIYEISGDDHSMYIMLSNLYASVEKWDKVREVRSKIKELGVKKNPGCSWIEIENGIQPFFVEDRSTARTEVYECLTFLYSHMGKDEFLDSNKAIELVDDFHIDKNREGFRNGFSLRRENKLYTQ